MASSVKQRHPTNLPANGQEHRRISISDENEGPKIDAQENEGRILPAMLPGFVQEERDADGVVAVEERAKVGQA